MTHVSSYLAFVEAEDRSDSIVRKHSTSTRLRTRAEAAIARDLDLHFTQFCISIEAWMLRYRALDIVIRS